MKCSSGNPIETSVSDCHFWVCSKFQQTALLRCINLVGKRLCVVKNDYNEYNYK